MLTEEERRVAGEVLRDSEQHLNRLLTSLDEARWRRVPSPEAWSIAQIAEHLVDLEERTLSAIERALMEAPASSEEVERVRGKERKLISAVGNRERRVAAPAGFEVSGRFATSAEAFTAFAILRARSIAMLDRDGLDEHLFPHFVFRQMSCYQWLILLGVHATRHCLQIEEVLNTSGVTPTYPATL